MADETIERGLELLSKGHCDSVAQAARNSGAKRSTLQEHWLRMKRGEPVAGESFTVEGLPSKWTPEQLLREHGLDPEKWAIARIRVNRWDDEEKPKVQLRVDVVPKSTLIEIKQADPSKWKAPKPRKGSPDKPLKAVVISDHHAPFHEPVFHQHFLSYIADEQPDIIDVNGDLLDFATVSRHRERDAFTSPVNDCIQAGHEILADYRSVCPEATIRYKRGNHEERLRNYLIDSGSRQYADIKAANEELPALDLQRLLKLDELKVEYVPEEWEQAKTKLSRKLTARHGFTTAKNGAVAILDRLSGSTVQGHDHRLWVAFRTGHEEEDLRVQMAMSTGCACIIPGGLGYVTGGEPDWQNSCAGFRIWPDGNFHPAVGIFVKGSFYAPNSKRYT